MYTSDWIETLDGFLKLSQHEIITQIIDRQDTDSSKTIPVTVAELGICKTVRLLGFELCPQEPQIDVCAFCGHDRP